MRDLLISKGQNIIYCFEITPSDGSEKLFLCSYSKQIRHDYIIYHPHCGLSIVEASFNDSADSLMIIHGIFEEKSITKNMAIAGSSVKVSVYNDKKMQHFVTLYCKNFIKNDLDFTLELVSEAEKYKQSLLKSYSKTCRADFGDKLCKIDKKKYEATSEDGEAKGCDKKFITCCKRYNNAVNFRGEPFLESVKFI